VGVYQTIMKIYEYVGSDAIKSSVSDFPAGVVVRSLVDLRNWINSCDKSMIASGLVIATFVIDTHGDLCLADRRSEHVACAGMKAVLSAGEIFFNLGKNGIEVCDITNQSTGYCPEINSWEYVDNALNKIPIDHPSWFTVEFTFRQCCSCSQINIIKDNLFICSVCDAHLPSEWNF
jgi:hypothetical protein